MTRIESWSSVVQKFKARLSKWKTGALSVGGRLTLLKSVLGSISTYYLSVFKAPMSILKLFESLWNKFFIGGSEKKDKITRVPWDKALRSRDRGGLGVGSLFALNRALLFKWKWKFFNETSNLWVMVIKALYGDNGDANNQSNRSSSNTCWFNVLKAINNLKGKGVNLDGFIKKKVGDGMSTYFWKDIWVGDTSFMQKYPRIVSLTINKDILVRHQLVRLDENLRRRPRGGRELTQWNELCDMLDVVVLDNCCDRWEWSLGSEKAYTVSSAREFIDEVLLGDGVEIFHWNSLIPIKVNVFIWKLVQRRLPTKDNLMTRGVAVLDYECVNCDAATESINHIFFSCSMARDLWNLCGRWCGLDFPVFWRWEDWVFWLLSLRAHSQKKKVLEAISYVILWSIWVHRNATSFGDVKPRKGDLFHKVVITSFNWISSRARKVKLDWLKWLCNPFM